MAGIVTGNLSPENKTLGFCAFFVLFCLIILTFYYNKKLIFLFLLGLVFSWGYLSIQFKLYPVLPSHHILNYLDSGKVTITGRVVSFARHYKRKSKRTLLCQAIKTEAGIQKNVTGKIIISIYGVSDRTMGFGDIIEFKSSIRSIRNFMNPGAFDYKKFLKLKKIFGTAYTDIEKIKILTPGNQINFYLTLIRKIENLRTGFYHFLIKNHTETGKILASLITGKKEVVSQETRDLFSKTGISHLLAISGLHLSIVSVIFFSLFYWVLSFFPSLLMAGQSKKVAGILTIIPMIFYAVFSGFAASTQRALIMIIVLMFSFVSEKEKDILSSLSVAGLMILAMDAGSLLSISFQLSFIAVIFIFSGLSLLKNVSLIHENSMVSKICLMISVTFFAGLGTLPLTAHYFNMTSHVQLLSNLVAIPVLGFIVLPLGLIALSLFSSFPLCAAVIICICSGLVSFLLHFAKLLLSIPFSWARTMTLQWSETALIYLIIISLFFMFKKKSRLSVSFFIIGLLYASYNYIHLHSNPISDPDLKITIMDVGQGSSSLIQTPEGQNILVDGGGFSDGSSFDTGRFIVAPFLWQKKIKKLDYVILTHPESDHLNGLVFILENFFVHTLIKNGDTKKTLKYMALIRAAKAHHIRILNPLKEGRIIDSGSIRFLFLPSLKKWFLNNTNNNSLVFKLIYKDFSMLFTGDILMHREENLVLKNGRDLFSDILLSPHHGSSSSSTKVFLDKVQPESVIISCGWHNRYGFPHDNVLKRYKDGNMSLFRTDVNGAVFISSNGKNHIIQTFKGE